MYQKLSMLLMLLCVLTSEGADAQIVGELRGSPTSVAKMYKQARAHDFTFMATPASVNRFVQIGLLVRLTGSQNYELEGVSFPVVRPETKLFVERLSQQFRQGCGEKLVVTSATRPTQLQPRNASTRSVHPTGMAVDFRIPRSSSCQRWLERNLLIVERAGVVEATRERNPPHFHVAVFSRPYADYVAARTGNSVRYQVKSGDNLTRIAAAHGSTVTKIKTANNLHSSTIRVGQVLRIPR